MTKVIDEKHIGMFRLLILDSAPIIGHKKHAVINGNKFRLSDVYDMKNAISVKCDKSYKSMINESVSFED